MNDDKPPSKHILAQYLLVGGRGDRARWLSQFYIVFEEALAGSSFRSMRPCAG
jgi:hypothetical protein